MRLLSWNVNGIRAVLRKGFMEFFRHYRPDILLLQETKASSDSAQLLLPGYEQYWNSAEKKGYAGTAVFTKVKPLSVQYGIGSDLHDKEGRVIILELAKFYLINVYTPNSQRGLGRHGYRQRWDKDFLQFILKLEKRKPIIFAGDLNVAHKEIDLANPKTNKKNAGFTAEEREGFQRYIDAGYIDTFRELNKEPGHYTWWGYFRNLRARNIGWRVDYFMVSKRLRKRLKDAFILSKVMGSDHCPIGIELGLTKLQG
jgi:exodeoxyribonuclease-3